MDHVPHRLAHQTPKHVPLLLVADRSAADRDGVRSDEFAQPRQRRAPRVDGEGEAEITRRVLVPDVGDCGVWERGEKLERGVHLCARAFEELAATCDEERVAREDRTRATTTTTTGRGRVGHVVADRVLGVAGRCETSGIKYKQPRRSDLAERPRDRAEIDRKDRTDGPDVERFADGELVVSFD